ncbi:unnamed protein product [Rotaria sp. Silwood1]|nr:unnamed protein product [Rotaria sp. Silwood1]CAF1190989.1 unnamed protein product [Rotaria sp. Silwood1]CAF3437102.1 unnamed protein product [Rotaria sp. Silwood1]CAF4723451.1 unnamed protein product [Rotaria sp. Silwood1]
MLGKSPVIKIVLFGIFAFGIGVIVLNAISYGRRQNDLNLNEKHNRLGMSSHDTDETIASKTGSKSTRLPMKKIDIFKIPIRTYKIPLNNETHKNILVHESGTGDRHVLLLHSKKYSSEIWKKIGTLQYLSSWGYRAFAINIPLSENKTLLFNENKAIVQWFKKLIKTLQLSNLVIISPSISGRLTLPYMFNLDKQQELIRGFVYISPIGTEQYNISKYEEIEIPTLIVYGKQDTKFLSAFEILKKIPTSEVLLIKNGSHDCYYEYPDKFHHGLRRFLDKIYRINYQKIRKFSKKENFSSYIKKSQEKQKQ